MTERATGTAPRQPRQEHHPGGGPRPRWTARAPWTASRAPWTPRAFALVCHGRQLAADAAAGAGRGAWTSLRRPRRQTASARPSQARGCELLFLPPYSPDFPAHRAGVLQDQSHPARPGRTLQGGIQEAVRLAIEAITRHDAGVVRSCWLRSACSGYLKVALDHQNGPFYASSCTSLNGAERRAAGSKTAGCRFDSCPTCPATLNLC